MKIIFNKAATDQLFTSTMAHNQTVRRRWRAFSLILSVIAGASVPVLGSISGRTGLSLLLVSIICGFFLPAFFRDFVPAFKFMPERASFLYAAIYSKSKTPKIEIEDIGKKECKLILSAEINDRDPIRGVFRVPIERDAEITEIIVNLEKNVVYLPITKNK